MNRVLISFAGLAAAALQPVLAQPFPEHSGDLAADLLPSLTVVADYGGEPARPYYVAIGMAGVPEEQGYVPDPRAPVTISEQDMLPVVSELMTPGLVQARSLDLPAGTTPFFLVGDDDLSAAWLDERGEILRELNAVGLVVQVQDLEGLEQLRTLAQGLEMRPMSGDDLAGRLGLSHFPVLITATGLEQ